MIHTIEDNFDFQFVQALKEMFDDYKEEKSDTNFEDYVWENRKTLGEKLFTQAMEHYDMEELISQVTE